MMLRLARLFTKSQAKKRCGGFMRNMGSRGSSCRAQSFGTSAATGTSSVCVAALSARGTGTTTGSAVTVGLGGRLLFSQYQTLWLRFLCPFGH